MNSSSRLRALGARTAAGAAIAAIAASVLALPAHAAPATVFADGAALVGTVQPDGSFTATVDAPAGSTVKFKLDGTYLGQDRTAPYSWPVTTGAGTHKLNARWETPAGRQEATVSFSVAAAAQPVKPAKPVVSTPAPKPAKPAAPAPKPAPKPAPAAPAGVVQVSTAAALKSALASAQPGQVIELRDGRYIGAFTASASGTAAAPITLRGSRNAVLSTGSTASGYGLHVTGSNWRITGISVASSAKGIVLDGSKNTVISGVDVGTIGAEAVHFRSGSADGAIVDSFIHDTGLKQPEYGEGVYLGSAKSNWTAGAPDRSDRITVRGNRITNTSAEGVDIKEGTTGGVIAGNVFTNSGMSGANYADSWIDVKGNGYRIEGNSGLGTRLDAFQVHSVLAGWGTGNVFRGNTVQGGVPGYEVWVQSASLNTTIACASSGAARGLSNIACR
ncbi:right-handed parallel beta-helix repeat-containing protein [Arthrobacter sp. MDT1-48-3]